MKRESLAVGRLRYVLLTAMLSCHAALLAWSAMRHSPTVNEPAHLAAGLWQWTTGHADLYRVNPPFARLLASWPVALLEPKADWRSHDARPGYRTEFRLGRDFIAANGQRAFEYVTLARWACLPLSLVGACICYCWASELDGRPSGCMAAALWCFDPNILAHASLCTADAVAAVVGVAAGYSFWRWLREPSWNAAAVAGVALGLAASTKFTWGLLFALWPVLWLAWRRPLGKMALQSAIRELGQLVCGLATALYVVNLVYAFDGSFTRLGDFTFVSRTLSGREWPASLDEGKGNRFTHRRVGSIRVPLPADYVRGIDEQRSDFERENWSYLRGRWRRGGVWYYYLYGLAVKVPLGTWFLGMLAAALTIFRREYRSAWRDELAVLAPGLAVLALASSQTGMNEHVRYVLPSLPFAFIWISKVSRAVRLRHLKVLSVAGALLCWAIVSSIWVYPHSLSYFNELAGGPANGRFHLLGSNVDWGHDLFYLKRWLARHPDASPLYLDYEGGFDPRDAGIDYQPIVRRGDDLGADEHRSGWYAVSVNRLESQDAGFAFLRAMTPVSRAGFSILIYRLTAEGIPDATR